MIATKRLIDAVWTLRYDVLPNGHVQILSYSHRDAAGYMFERQLPTAAIVEQKAGRIAIAVDVDGTRYTVLNQRYIFDYPLPEALKGRITPAGLISAES